ncbi:MAG: isoprenylcysteine carboxylmethyltransferase family protein [Candidatus Omnitrophota bacterium]|jgi:protein-S-isoprenylcysteine O-methyltransferase Ste14
MKKRIRIQGFLIFLAVLALVIFYKHLLPVSQNSVSRVIVDGLGVMLFLSGYSLRIMARGYKAELNPDGKTLITRGPYALTRNPMYLGTLMISLGIILLLLKWWTGLVFLAVFLIIYVPEIKKEEVRLHRAFGDEFKEYCKVPRFFPAPVSLLRPDKQNSLEFKFAWLKKEISSLVPTLLFVGGVKIWEFHHL